MVYYLYTVLSLATTWCRFQNLQHRWENCLWSCWTYC